MVEEEEGTNALVWEGRQETAHGEAKDVADPRCDYGGHIELFKG